jgi:subtilase family serine protease
MLSAIPDPQAVPDGAIPLALSEPGSATQVGFTPTQISTAYGINQISFNGTPGTGANQTIAIIGAYDNPAFVDTGSSGFATSDLHLFDQAMGLADPPSFLKVDQDGGTDYPTTNDFWANETALDVEWTHALAPQANILLIECASTNLSNLIEEGVQYATTVPGVSVVTMSFAVPEFMGETSYDSFLESPSGHGITFVAASGDQGSPGNYPAFSPNVVSVGGTSLTLSGNSWSSETGWDSNDGNVNSSGGGISAYETKPSYQFGVTQSSSMRTNPDVAFDGNPNTGVAVYDSFNGGVSTPWYKEAGTSFSAPAFASLVAIADQGRAQLGLTSLDGPSQTLPALYSVSSSDFHDITSGNNGFAAVSGYDLVTGRGTPIANKLVPDLAGGNSVTGTVFTDSNGNGVKDSNENGLAGVTVFTDLYDNGIFEGADQEVISGSNGTYDLTNIPGGTYRISATPPSGYELTTGTGSNETGTFGTNTTGRNFGLKATATPTQLSFAQVTSSATAGMAFSEPVIVDVESSNGSIVASDNSTVTLSLANGTGTLGGTLSETAVDGVATFSNISLSVAGAYMLEATDGSLTSTTSSSISVSSTSVAPAGSILAFSQQPTMSTVATAITPPIMVDVENAGGTLLSSDGSSVTLAIASGIGTLGGTLTEDAVNGVATFSDITLSQPGTFTLSASDGSLTPITSASFGVTAIPTQVAFSVQPATTNAGAAISHAIIVDVDDAGGNTVTTDGSPVTLSIASGTGTLGGTLTVNAVDGVATFSDVTVSTAGAFTLTATDGSLTAATSNSVTITTPGVIAPAITHSTLATSLVSGAKVKSVVTLNETNTSANISSGTIVTNIFATSSDGTQVLLGTVSKKESLKASKRVAVSVPITTVPSTLVGTYVLQAQIVDPNGQNQIVNGTALTAAAPFISLSEAITKLTLASAVIGGAKNKATATVKVTNTGNIPSAGVTTTRIYLSPDGTINSGEVINSVTKSLTIKPGASDLITVPLSQIPSTLMGKLDVLAEVTDPNAVRTFVNSGSQVTVASPFVDITGTVTAPVPATIAPNGSVSITLTLTNTGNIAAAGSARFIIGISPDGTTQYPGPTTLMKTVNILPGKSLVEKLKIIIPDGLTAGKYFPFITFDQTSTSVNIIGTTAMTVT